MTLAKVFQVVANQIHSKEKNNQTKIVREMQTACLLNILSIMFRKILVPYDNSKPADNAIKHAAELAKSIVGDTEIILLQVVPNLPASPLLLERPVKTRKGEILPLSEYIKQLYQEMQINATEGLEKKKKEIEQDLGSSNKVTIRILVLLGDSVSDSIVEFAEKEKADLIIIGNIGLTGFSKLKTLGSVSRAVSERSSCPVLIVH